MHWVNRVCVQAATMLASEIGAEVINELELWGKINRIYCSSKKR
jgi:hypothetical protein